jgi:transcriptional repressor NrdR
VRCPNCGLDEDRVLDTRVVREGSAIRRRRECLGCKRRFTTYEYVEKGEFVVVKKDGRREPFSRDKLVLGLSKACEKRPIPSAAIEEWADRIEAECARTGRSEVLSSDIGSRVLEALRGLDPVAYVRFASVYLNFSDIRQFLETIRQLPIEGIHSSWESPAEPEEPNRSATTRSPEGGDADPAERST